MDVERKFPGPYWWFGKVINRKDPEGLYRIKARVPGQLEETDWALPFGMMTGKKRGGGAVPAKNSSVLLFWAEGDIDKTVFYLSGAFFRNWVPTGTVIEDDDGKDNLIWQNDRMRVEIDTRNDSAGLRVTNLVETEGSEGETIDSAGTDVSLELDFVTGQAEISTALGLKLRSTGVIEIEGGMVVINGRMVSPGEKPL